MKCPSCGAEVPQTKFCTECGAKLPESAPAPTPAPYPVPIPPPPPPPKRNVPLLAGLIAGAAVVLAVLVTVIVSFSAGGKAEVATLSSAPSSSPEATSSEAGTFSETTSSEASLEESSRIVAFKPKAEEAATARLWDARFTLPEGWQLDAQVETGYSRRLFYRSSSLPDCELAFTQSYLYLYMDTENSWQNLSGLFYPDDYTLISEEWREQAGVRQLFCEYTYPDGGKTLYRRAVISITGQIASHLYLSGPQEEQKEIRTTLDAVAASFVPLPAQIEYPGNAKYVRPADWVVTGMQGAENNPTSITYSTGEISVKSIRFDRAPLSAPVSDIEAGSYCQKAMRKEGDIGGAFTDTVIVGGPAVFRYTCERIEGGVTRAYDMRMIVGTQETYLFTLVTDPKKTNTETKEQLDITAASLNHQEDWPETFRDYQYTRPGQFLEYLDSTPETPMYFPQYQFTGGASIGITTMSTPDDFSGTLEELSERYRTDDKINYSYEMTELNGIPAVDASFCWTTTTGTTFYHRSFLLLQQDGSIVNFYFYVPAEENHRRFEDDFLRMMNSLTIPG